MVLVYIGIPLWFFVPIMVWEIIWKGIGLWKSAKNRQFVWFIFILLINSVGLLPMIYLIWFQRNGQNRVVLRKKGKIKKKEHKKRVKKKSRKK